MEPGTDASLPSRARAVATLADAHATWGDEHGQLAPQVVDALHEEGLYGMWVPRTLPGGAELDAVSSLQVLENLAYGDPSTGWVLMASALAIGTAGSYLPDDAVEILFGGERLPVIAGQGTRPGVAVPVAGGYRLTGTWSFASGIKHSTFIHTLGLIQGTNEARIFVVPVADATLIDNWDVLGLRATGSIDYRIDDVYVPESFTHVATTAVPLRGGSFYTLGIIGIACICHAGWACGIGRRLLDELATSVRAKAGRAGTLADSDSFQEQYARAEAGYRAARALVFETWTDIQQTLSAGAPLSVRQHTMMRLAMANVTWASHAVSEFVYMAGGTAALRAGTLQRLFRDMHAGTQHITSSPPVFARAGRELAGLAPGKRWLFLDLIDS
jgi:alkylation response protein AidB-like acyl-CoA dehydrogenase